MTRPVRRGYSVFAFSAAAMLAVVGTVSTARADDVADFYKGRTIAILIGVGLGGSYGTNAHLFSTVFKSKVPGQPNVIVQEMAGAGGAKMVNYLYNVAPKDGTVIALPLKYIAVNQALGLSGLKYDANKFNYIGSLGPINSVVAVWAATTPARAIQDAMTKQVIVGSTGKSSETFMTPTLMNNLLGTKFKIVLGYKGTAAIHIAMERGELHGVAASWESVKGEKPDWLRDKKVILLAQSGIKRTSDLPNLPTLIDLAGTPEQKEILKFVANGNAVGWMMMAPPRTPAERVAALRMAFDATVKDPAYVASMKARNLDVEPATGAEVQALIKDTLSESPAMIAKIKTAMGME